MDPRQITPGVRLRRLRHSGEGIKVRIEAAGVVHRGFPEGVQPHFLDHVHEARLLPVFAGPEIPEGEQAERVGVGQTGGGKRRVVDKKSPASVNVRDGGDILPIPTCVSKASGRLSSRFVLLGPCHHQER